MSPQKQPECKALLQRYLQGAFGDLPHWDDGESAFVLPLGPYGLRVRPCKVEDGGSVIDIYTWLGRDVDVTPTLARWMLERNARLRFGALAIDCDGDIVLTHALLPGTLDDQTLARVIDLMTVNADELEAELIQLR